MAAEPGVLTLINLSYILINDRRSSGLSPLGTRRLVGLYGLCLPVEMQMKSLSSTAIRYLNMTQTALEPACLYAVLFSRGDGTFHWTICAAVDERTAMKMHATNTLAWVYEQKMHDILESVSACVAVKIGKLSSTADIDRVSSLLEKIPMSIPPAYRAIERRFRCRIWFKEALRALTTEGFISCPDVEAFERELLVYGEERDDLTVSGAPLVFQKSSVVSV
ncbi:hypothetical protein EUX98_g3586 [Antrodiella citrinella]|uniref:Uncharacterized protein n=1 Tax=Antrodiella citrinella TaxID=2447956 RepID=A0A4S4MW67_9APHY|nr:hypothetical protein EUX98_g3586 [Antrodiella citrinella]